MKRVETRLIGSALRPLSAVLLLFCTVASAFAVTPYEAIVGRNVFGLKPPTPVTNVVETPTVPAPKIRLQGLTTILGRRQVLFKAMLPAKPGEPAREQASVLSEGQREGEIEVLEINEITGTVKFNNYGYPQTLNMKDDAEKPAGGAVAAGLPQPGVVPPPPIPGMPAATPTFAPPPGVPMPRPNSALPSNIPTRALRTTPTGPGGLGLNAGTPQPAEIPAEKMTPEMQTILIEVQREQQKNNPNWPPLPPTEVTPLKPKE